MMVIWHNIKLSWDSYWKAIENEYDIDLESSEKSRNFFFCAQLKNKHLYGNPNDSEWFLNKSFY